ncbi:glucokinase [Alloacidobacterium dinghuense]|uniref:Glucokinase n=1 Tax=Alloacidobacterium dinghuense TaxID=2763107 RepID=A0A7G8BJS9_9BACT|nr:glucokinase [Alloacidobacterium dinghuense]QNI32799.1 glucokinase [Alloacidobacterium dinghuense]
MILAGDVGGTKVDLALYGFENGELTLVREERFPAQEYSGLEVIAEKFLADTGNPEVTAACFGVPGPVRHGRLKLTNLPWILDCEELSTGLDIRHLFLINDLEANGYGIPELHADQIHVLSEGDASAVGNRALVSAGTGLGQAILVWNGKMHIPMASEGGHCDFAPRDEMEIDLMRYLQRVLKGRVSFERVVSGIGLKNIYAFLRDEKGMDEPTWLKERMHAEDPNAVIGEVGENGSNELCAKTLEMFVSAYGAEAGNLALKVLSVGGLYLGGGIAPKILKTMKDGAFMKAFVDKGRLSDLLIHTPVRIILESRAALLGAAAYAEARAAQLSGQSVRAASIQFS